MSYDISIGLTCEHCGERREQDIGNVTWNISSMVEKLFDDCEVPKPMIDGEPAYGWMRLKGMTKLEYAPHVKRCWQRIRGKREEYEPLNSPNGWGSVDCLVRILAGLREAVRDDNVRPNWKVNVS